MHKKLRETCSSNHRNYYNLICYGRFETDLSLVQAVLFHVNADWKFSIFANGLSIIFIVRQEK